MRKQIHLYGNRLYLRKIKKSDLNKTYLSWLKDPDVTKFMHAGAMSANKRTLLTYYSSFKYNKNDLLFALILKDSKKHIGNLRLGPIEWHHKRSEFGIMIGDKKSWGQGIAAEATNLVLSYAFKGLNLNRINIYVVEKNRVALALYNKVGFTIEGCKRNNFYCEGKYSNTIVMGMLRKEFLDHDTT